MINSVTVLMRICLAALAISACGGGGSSAKDTNAEPVANISGNWRITEISTDNNCDEGIDSPYTLQITQSGNDLSVFNPNLGQTFSGKIAGTSIEWKESYPEDGGTMELDPVNATVAGDSISGTSKWRWSDGFDSCSGTTQFAGGRQ